MFKGKALRCDCGFQVRADDENALVAKIRKHAFDAHGICFTEEDAVAVLLRSELGIPAEIAAPHPKGDSRS